MSDSNQDAGARRPHRRLNAAGDDVHAGVDASSTPVDLDVSWLVPADLAAVDALARLQLAAFRCGRSLCLHGADGGLAELVELVGLRDALPVRAPHPLTTLDEDSREV